MDRTDRDAGLAPGPRPTFAKDGDALAVMRRYGRAHALFRKRPYDAVRAALRNERDALALKREAWLVTSGAFERKQVQLNDARRDWESAGLEAARRDAASRVADRRADRADRRAALSAARAARARLEQSALYQSERRVAFAERFARTKASALRKASERALERRSEAVRRARAAREATERDGERQRELLLKLPIAELCLRVPGVSAASAAAYARTLEEHEVTRAASEQRLRGRVSVGFFFLLTKL